MVSWRHRPAPARLPTRAEALRSAAPGPRSRAHEGVVQHEFGPLQPVQRLLANRGVSRTAPRAITKPGSVGPAVQAPTPVAVARARAAAEVPPGWLRSMSHPVFIPVVSVDLLAVDLSADDSSVDSLRSSVELRSGPRDADGNRLATCRARRAANDWRRPSAAGNGVSPPSLVSADLSPLNRTVAAAPWWYRSVSLVSADLSVPVDLLGFSRPFGRRPIAVEGGQRAHEQRPPPFHRHASGEPSRPLVVGRGQPPPHLVLGQQRLERLPDQPGQGRGPAVGRDRRGYASPAHHAAEIQARVRRVVDGVEEQRRSSPPPGPRGLTSGRRRATGATRPSRSGAERRRRTSAPLAAIAAVTSAPPRHPGPASSSARSFDDATAPAATTVTARPPASRTPERAARRIGHDIRPERRRPASGFRPPAPAARPRRWLKNEKSPEPCGPAFGLSALAACWS